MRRTLRLLIVLAALVATAVALGHRVQTYSGPLLPETAAGPADPAPKGGGADILEVPRYVAPPAERFAGIVERPLFAQSRRPVEVEATPVVVPETASLDATLQGVLFSATGKVALITVRDSPDLIRVSENQLFLGWRVEQIEPNSATFRRGDKTIVLRLKYKPGD